LDDFVEKVLVPEYNRGKLRARNPQYRAVELAIMRARYRGDRAQVRSLYRQLHRLPSQDPNDPDYRRLRYCRYADDTLIGFVGSKAEAEQIKQRLSDFLHDDLALKLSPEKTLITHARTERARFLGYEISVCTGKHRTSRTERRNRRSVNGVVRLQVPTTAIKAKCAPFLARGKPTHRNDLVNDTDYTIVGKYGAQYRGIVGYYLLAGDVHRLHRLRWVMETSMLKTLARKHRSTVSKMAGRFKTKVVTPQGMRVCFQAAVQQAGRNPLVAQFGGIPLNRNKNAVLTDRVSTGPTYPQRELVKRLLNGRCELCRGTDDIAVHHVRSLAELVRSGQRQNVWAQTMAKRRRKSLVVCGECHTLIHAQPAASLTQ
jgi:hypothetical protein